METVAGLLREAPMLRRFFTEAGNGADALDRRPQLRQE